MFKLDVFALLVDQSPDAMFFVAPDGSVRFWNSAAEAMLGYPSSMALGQDFAALIVPYHA